MTCLIAILAAGRAERFGGGKLDERCVDGRLGSWAVRAACKVGSYPVAIVSAPKIPPFAREEAERRSLDIIVAADAEAGLSRSVGAAADAALKRDFPLVLMAADMPLVRSKTIGVLVNRALNGVMAAAVHTDGELGIPAAFPVQKLPALKKLAGDRGAGNLLRQWANVATVNLTPEELIDVDDRADLDRVRKILSDRRF